MPKPVDIEIFLIAQTKVDRTAVEKWLAFLGVSDEFELPDEETVTDPALLVAMAAKGCYQSFEVNPDLNPNVTKIRKDYAAYLDNVLASGHGSVLEHSVFSFAIQNVSRVFTGEMNRHRAGWAISEKSMRFCRFGDEIPYWVPTSIAGVDVLGPTTAGEIAEELILNKDAVFASTFTNKLEVKKQLSREVFNRVFGAQEMSYRALEKIWADELKSESKFHDKKNVTSMMRRIVGMGVATGGVWTGNARALRHVITMRASPAAEEEILHVFSRVAKMMSEAEPMLFGDFYQDEQGFWRPKYLKV